MGLGNYTRSNAEYSLPGVRGKGVRREAADVQSIVETMKLEHSGKPAEIRPCIVALTGNLPRIELFARHRVRNGMPTATNWRVETYLFRLYPY
jgi:site-specific DNA-methyltransferase (adenine-specific)